VDTSAYRSKSWDEFTQTDAPQMRIVVTVCDNAANEVCPIWPGSPVRTHWGYPDPSNAEGGDDGKRRAYELTRQAIGYRMLQLLALPLDTMGNAELQAALTTIAKA
jgi:arsenate reductase